MSEKSNSATAAASASSSLTNSSSSPAKMEVKNAPRNGTNVRSVTAVATPASTSASSSSSATVVSTSSSDAAEAGVSSHSSTATAGLQYTDVLQLIFRYLTLIPFVNAARISRVWRDVVYKTKNRDGTLCIGLGHLPSFSASMPLLRHIRSVETSRFKSDDETSHLQIWPPSIFSHLAQLPSLTSIKEVALELDHPLWREMEELVRTSNEQEPHGGISNWPHHLESISIYLSIRKETPCHDLLHRVNATIIKICSRLPNLTSIQINTGGEKDDVDLTPLNSLLHLRRLAMHLDLSVEAVRQQVRRLMSRLTYICLHPGYWPAPPGEMSYPSYWPDNGSGLTRLLTEGELPSVRTINEIDLGRTTLTRELLLALPCLPALTALSATVMGPDALPLLASQLPYLRRLKLPLWNVSWPVLLPTLLALTELRSFQPYCYRFHAIPLHTLFPSLPRVEELRLEECVFSARLRELATLPHLNSLTLTSTAMAFADLTSTSIRSLRIVWGAANQIEAERKKILDKDLFNKIPSLTSLVMESAERNRWAS